MSPGRTWAGLAAVTSLACLLATSFVATPADGTATPFPLDPMFAPTQPVPGLVRLQLDGLPALASHVRVLPDGSSIVALGGISSLGFGDYRHGLAKFRADGSLDTSFNPGGPTPGALDFQNSEIIEIDIDSVGRILVAGLNMVTRLLADGSPDTSFVATCIAPCSPGHGQDPPIAPPGGVYVNHRVYDLNVLSDDSVLIESSTEINASQFVMYLIKLTTSGDRDLTFNPSGTLPGLLIIDDYGPADVFPQPDGSFLVVALSLPPRLHRVTAGGVLDMTFGGGTGIVSPQPAHSDEEIWSAYADGPDRIVLLVSVPFPAGPPSLLRIKPDGSTDPTFGVTGRVDLAALGTTGLGAVFVQDDHRIVVEVMQASYEISLARLTAEGMLDASFNRLSPTPGWLLVDPGPDGDHYHNILDLVQVDDGHLLAAGGRTRRPPITPNDTLAEVYRFNGFDTAPHPIPLYPMSSPPMWVAHLVIRAVAGGATATQPAVRVPTP